MRGGDRPADRHRHRNERRVTYTQAASGGRRVPRSLRAFDYSDSDALADERDLWLGMGIALRRGGSPESVIRRARQLPPRHPADAQAERTVTVTDPGSGDTRTLTYVAGDFFHADPLQLGGPSNFFYLANDLGGNGEACDDLGTPNPGLPLLLREPAPAPGALAGSNDGQLHAFDAGISRD